MKVLFIASGNKFGNTVSSFVRSQYESLEAAGLDMLLYPVTGHGWKAYLRAVFAVRRLIRKEKPDIIHAHYTTCGFVASLATMGMRRRPKIMVSVLGSFPTRNAKWRRVRWAVQHLWEGTLTKSKRTADQLGFPLPVVPNGVNLEIFHQMDKDEARRQVCFDTSHQSAITNHKYIIWCSNPERPEKNWLLAQLAIQYLNQSSITNSPSGDQLPISNQQLPITNIELIPVYNKTPQEVALYMNAADCLLLTSWSEGSPNVIKEAMACNCPIVTTDVGDVNERLDGLNGCFVAKTAHPVTNEATHAEYAEENARELAACLAKALQFGKRTKGYERIIADGLTIEQTAQKIINWYELSF